MTATEKPAPDLLAAVVALSRRVDALADQLSVVVTAMAEMLMEEATDAEGQG